MDCGHAGAGVSVNESIQRCSQRNGGVTITGGADGSSSVTFQESVAAINTAMDGLVYQPAGDFNGADTLNVSTSDLGNTGTGGILTDFDAVGITVTAVNDGPGNTKTHSFPETLLRYGMLRNWLEFRISWNYADEEAGGVSANGSEDLYLGFKIGLTPQWGIAPEMALIPQMTIFLRSLLPNRKMSANRSHR